MKHHYTLVLIFFLSFVLPAFAQVSFIIPDKRVVKGNLIGAEIHVKTRDSISAFQFTLEWNPLILEFNTVDSVSLPDVSMDIFGLNNVVDGNLKFLWVSNATEGVRFKDSVLIFKVLFKAIGGKGTNSLVKFTNSLIRIKAINFRIESLPVTTRDGVMTIEGSSAIGDLNHKAENIKLYQNIPNPLSNQTMIPFELKEADIVTLQIYDAIGRMVFEKKEMCAAGMNEMALYTEGVLQKGMYVYCIRTRRDCISKKMIRK